MKEISQEDSSSNSQEDESLEKIKDTKNSECAEDRTFTRRFTSKIRIKFSTNLKFSNFDFWAQSFKNKTRK